MKANRSCKVCLLICRKLVIGSREWDRSGEEVRIAQATKEVIFTAVRSAAGLTNRFKVGVGLH